MEKMEPHIYEHKNAIDIYKGNSYKRNTNKQLF